MDLEKIITQIYEDTKPMNSGNVADYIPQLAKVNPELYGITVCNSEGQIFSIGDSVEEFCIQSCAKPLSYCLARQLDEKNIVHAHVGKEPSGKPFNEHVLNKDGLPHNPVINAGAIMISSLILPELEQAERFEAIQDFYKKMSGGVDKIGYGNSVYLSEKKHAYRNISLGYYMLENKAFPKYVNSENLKHHLDLYFQCCSIQINTRIGAVMACTLANNGFCPISSRKVVDSDINRDCLSIMFACGMYDYSGRFAFEVGLPAKSGVSGCILLVIPKIKTGICIWSPRLDENGNSARGIEFCKELTKRTRYAFHAWYNSVDTSSVAMSKEHLISAAAEGNLEKVKILVEEFGPNITDYDKRTPLHLAAAEGRLEIVKYLIDNNANADSHDRWGNTPTHEVNLSLKKIQDSVDDSTSTENYHAILDILSHKIEIDSE